MFVANAKICEPFTALNATSLFSKHHYPDLYSRPLFSTPLFSTHSSNGIAALHVSHNISDFRGRDN